MHDRPFRLVPAPGLMFAESDGVLGCSAEMWTVSLPYPPGEEIHVYSYVFLLILSSCQYFRTVDLLVMALMFKIMTDQIVDFECVEDLGNKRCVTGPLSDGYRSSHSTTRVGPRAWV
jgi:hypothetical protein